MPYSVLCSVRTLLLFLRVCVGNVQGEPPLITAAADDDAQHLELLVQAGAQLEVMCVSVCLCVCVCVRVCANSKNCQKITLICTKQLQAACLILVVTM